MEPSSTTAKPESSESPNSYASIGFAPAAISSVNRLTNGPNSFFREWILSSPTARNRRKGSPTLMESLILLITSGSNLTKILVSQEFNEYTNFIDCLEYIKDCMIKNGPIDGLLGFSQGAILSAALRGLQAQGLALVKVPKVKFGVIIGGAKLMSKTWALDFVLLVL